MIALKDYQVRVLSSVREFFRTAASEGDPIQAFQEVTARSFGVKMPYLPVSVEGLDKSMPYVCLRVPTGGGKTLLACYAAGLATEEFLQAARAVVLWLVPSNTILEQTADALRDPRHPYRRALELACGAVEVLTIEEALGLSRATADGQTVVVVATIQAFRAEDTTGRKVYEQNGALAEHFLNVPANLFANVWIGADGKPKPSLVNVLRLRRPIVIVDEAHNARTDLSFAALGNVLPSCVIEFTATPARKEHPSNVLHHVSAAELKAASMVKLPLRVITRHPSQRDQLLGEAITLRADLERLAVVEGQKTGEYLRPIVLIQAERVDACEPLRDRMVAEYRVPKDHVKISVGKLDELKSVKNISDPECPVRFIITVEKLREGWDCPFAYILCSLKETRSATAIEQIVGRILRLPSAQAKQQLELNCAYALSVSDSIGDVLAELRDALVGNGFTRAEAEKIIISVPQGMLSQGILPLGVQPKTIKVAVDEINPVVAQQQVVSLQGKAQINTASGDITILVQLDSEETEQLMTCLITPEAQAKVKEMIALVGVAETVLSGGGPRVPSAYEQNLEFVVPVLCVQENGELFEFESTFLLEQPWKLSTKEASLAATYDPLSPPTGRAGIVDVGSRGKVETTVLHGASERAFVATLHQQVLALGGVGEWSLESLITWLDRQIDHRDIPISESAGFLRNVIRGLITKFGIADVSVLGLDRFRLRDEVENRIRALRVSELKTAFQKFLLPESMLSVSDAFTINFRTMGYEPSWVYEGGYQFKKHFFGPKPGELRETTPSGATTEEFKCAQFIDSLEEVRFWVRNLARKATSFRLQTSTDWFYPDFMCQLADGRVLAVEYKGSYIYDSSDAEEKRAIGRIWAGRSEGRCLFEMPTAVDFAVIAGAAGSVG